MKIKSCILISMVSLAIGAQEREEFISFGNMDQWITREIKESGVIGGAVKQVFEIGPVETITGAEPYFNKGGSPWATSNVLAKVAGVVKTNTSVFPEERSGGYCARLESRMESVKVLGLVDITVLAAGSIFTGTMLEPIKGTKNPQKMLNSGIPFTQKPEAVRFDYKTKIAEREKRIRATGFSKITDVEGKDYPEVILLLHKRWEDEKGNLYAKRVGTMVVRFKKDVNEWQKDATYTILYGDITGHPEYDAELMALQREERYALNSKGNCVPVLETGWGEEEDIPTHLFLQFASSYGGAYIGSPGNTLWIDNVRLVY
ncbi:MAG: PCMD domain-containing protein [Bacteroides sp.]|nr:PCMD domain-containing protein [Bacteroides sp.]